MAEAQDSDVTRVMKCVVRDGRFVDPCSALEINTDNGQAAFGKAKGLTRWSYTNLTTHEPSRVFFGAKTKAHPNGFLFNWCPFCGVEISAPFMERAEEGVPA